jgi:hypothetical protein
MNVCEEQGFFQHGFDTGVELYSSLIKTRPQYESLAMLKEAYDALRAFDNPFFLQGFEQAILLFTLSDNDLSKDVQHLNKCLELEPYVK